MCMKKGGGQVERFVAWIQQLRLDAVWSVIMVVLASLVCIIFHETSHGRVAGWLGDPTAKQQGRLSWNPLKHIDVFGLVMMAIFHFGWAKAVPVNPQNFKHPKWDMAITALAGPVSNVILAFVVLLIRSVLYFFYLRSPNGVLEWVIELTEYIILLSVGLAVFNIIPISPLDGSKVLCAFLPDNAYVFVMRYERWGMLILMALLFTGILDTPLTFLRTGLLNGLQAVTWFPFTLLSRFIG